MKLRRVNPAKIHVPDVRVTAQMTEETAEQFKASVKEIGIDEPLKCFDVDGELWLSDGKHRLDEALLNNLPMVDVIVKEGTMVDVMCNNIMSGHLRGKHPISQMRASIEFLYKELKCGIEDIVKRTGYTRNFVENLLIVSELTPLCLEALDQEKIGIGDALVLAKIKDPVDQEFFFWQGQQFRLRGKAFRDFVKEVLDLRVAEPQTSAQSVPLQPALVKCAYCGEAHLPNEVASIITCRECAGIMYTAIGNARREALALAAANASSTETQNEVPQ